MEKLLNYFTIDEINNIFNKINVQETNEIDKLISILENIECDDETIKHIITSNPNFLTRDYIDVFNLKEKLQNLGITDLYTTFENNPYLLNKDAFEIDEFIKNKLIDGLDLDDIIDIIDNESYKIDE